jgi:predicted anti-sigma-YlaC factor YlaD
MRCGRAQKLIVAAVDGEITPERRRDLDEHVAGCTDCRTELHATQALFGVLEGMPQEAEVPALVEAATIRRMRIAAAEEREGKGRRWGWLSTPVLAAAGVVALALAINLRPGGEPGPVRPAPAPDSHARQVARLSEPMPEAAPQREAAAVATAEVAPPTEPPPDLAAAPELFMNLPIIRNMEKLEHFEAITMVELTPNG